MCSSWISIFSGLLAPLVAILTGYIGYHQWRTNRNKLKLDLFDRRYSIYQAATKTDWAGDGRGNGFLGAIARINRNTQGARFLFSDQVRRYLDNELYNKADDLRGLDTELRDLNETDDRKRNVEKQRKLKDWFAEQYNVADSVFAPYIQLSH